MRVAPLLAALVLAACVTPGAVERATSPLEASDDLRPTYEPLPEDERPAASQEPAATQGPVEAAPTTPAGVPQPTPAPTTEPSPAQPTGAPPPASPDPPEEILTGWIDDPAGDVRYTGLDRPPRHVDLRGGRLTRTPAGFELVVLLEGGAPQREEAGYTMNVAAFFDVTGDGRIDYEVWANVSEDGWGTGYFDNVEGRARFAGEDGVEVGVEDGELVLRFPLGHLAEARALRWSLATEWATYDTLGTPLAARDRAPDAGPAPFPRA